MDISVIICTYNRSANLKMVLDSLLNQKVKQNFQYEYLIVNNNSKDNTKDLIESYIPQFKGNMRYLFESQQGKPYALNLAIEQANGEILAFTDDDCILPDDYLQKIYETFNQKESRIDFVGGKVIPEWQGIQKPQWLDHILAQPAVQNGHPNWFKMFFQGPLVMLDYGNNPFFIKDSEQKNSLFYGANMAVRCDVLKKIGGYNTQRTLTQDTEICQRLTNCGAIGFYSPHVVVYHKVVATEITPAFFYRWYFKRGRYHYQKENYQRKFYHPLGVQISLIRQCIQALVKSLFVHSIAERVYWRSQGLSHLGQILEIMKRNII